MTTYLWTTTNGDWTTDADWNRSAYPDGTGADAVLGGTGTYDVTIDSSTTVTVHSITLTDPNATLTDDGALTLSGTHDVVALGGGTFVLGTGGALHGGTLENGTIVENGASLHFYHPITLDGITLLGPLQLSTANPNRLGDGSTVDVRNGLTVETTTGGPGIIDLTGPNATIKLLDSETWNNVTIKLGATDGDTLGYSSTLDIAPGATLTLGSGVTVTTKAGEIGYIDGGSLVNEGKIADAGGLLGVQVSGSFTNAGTITLTQDGYFGVNVNSVAGAVSAGFTNTGLIDIAAGASLSVDGSSVAFTNDGIIEAHGGLVTLSTAVAGTGTLRIDAAATLELGAGTSNRILFAGADSTLMLDTPGAAIGKIAGLSAGDTIMLGGATVDAVSSVGTTLDVSLADGTTLQYTLAAPLAGLSETVVDNGTAIEVVCFCRGTRIATPSGETPVETLRAGDPVTTISGAHRKLRWVGFGRTLVTPRNRDRATPVVVRRHALAENVPCRDLYITRGHSLFLEGVLIPVEELINHRSIAWVEKAQVVEYLPPRTRQPRRDPRGRRCGGDVS